MRVGLMLLLIYLQTADISLVWQFL